MIRILIADDHTLFSEMLADILNSNPDFNVVACCRDNSEALEISAIEKPDIVLMDINILPFSGIEATKKILATTTTKVIGLSMHAHVSYAKSMIAAGALGYISKNASTMDIFTAIHWVFEGKKYFSPDIKSMIVEQALCATEEISPADSLTVRELQVIKLITEGCSSKEIAGILDIGLKTVEVHRHNIFKKLKLKNSCSLVNFTHANPGYFIQPTIYKQSV